MHFADSAFLRRAGLDIDKGKQRRRHGARDALRGISGARRWSLRRAQAVLAAALGVGAIVTSASATTWSGLGADGAWSTGGNWVGGIAPVSSNTTAIVFTGGSNSLNAQDLASPFVLNSLTFDSSVSTYFGLQGNPIRFDGVNPTLTALTYYPVQLSTAIDLATTTTVHAEDEIDFFGGITGTGGLTISGSGSIYFAGVTPNSYTGVTTVGAGLELYLNKTGAEAVTGDLNVLGSVTVYTSPTGQINDNSVVNLNGGVLNLVSDSLPSSETLGGLAMTGGTVGSNNSLKLNGNVVTSASNNASYIYSGVDLNAASRIFTVADGAADVDLSIYGNMTNGTFVKQGAGVMALAGSNTFTSAPTVQAGELRVTTSSLTSSVINNAELVFAQNESSTYAGTISGSGNVTFRSDYGSYTFTLSGASTYGGTTTISGYGGPQVKLGSSERLPDGTALTLTFGATLDLAGFTETVGSLVLDSGTVTAGTLSAGSYQVRLGSIAANLTGAGGLTMNGDGMTVFLTGANSYSGGTVISAGTLQGKVASIQGSVTNNGQLVINDSASGTVNATIGGSGDLTVGGGGVITLGQPNTYSGATHIGSGTLRQGVAGAIPAGSNVYVDGTLDLNNFDTPIGKLEGGGNINLGTATLTVQSAQDHSFAGTTSGTGDFVQAGPGQLYYYGPGLGHTGETRVTGGTLYLTNPERLPDSGVVRVTGGGLVLSGTETIGSLILEGGGVFLDWDVHQLITSTLDLRAGILGPSLSGGATLNKTTNGTVELWQANTYTGGATIAAGTIVAHDVNALPGTTNNNGTVRFEQASGSTSNVIAGSGAVELISSDVTFVGANTYTGGTTITSSTLEGSAATIPGDIVLSSGYIVFDQSSPGTFAGKICGVGGLDKYGAAELVLTGNSSFSGQIRLSAGALAVGHDSALGSSILRASGNTTILAHGGSRVLANKLSITGNVTFGGSNDLTFSDKDLLVLGYGAELTNANTATTTIAAQFSGAAGSTLHAQAGIFVIGDPTSFIGFTTAGTLLVDAGATMSLRSAGFAALPALTTLNGGTLAAPNGVALGVGQSLVGQGTVNGKLTAQAGSTIYATGDFAIGSATNVAGYYSDGELYTNAHTVTLNDMNEAVLGTLTQVGDGLNPGTLTAANGSLLGFGRDLVGQGTIKGAFKNNGHVYVDPSAVLTFNGPVSGVGDFPGPGTVSFANSYSPGLSPASVNLNNVVFEPANVVVVELAGKAAGTQYDQIKVAQHLQFSGTLAIELLDGFVPDPTDTFTIISHGSRTGMFDTVTGRAIEPGRSLSIHYGASAVTAIAGEWAAPALAGILDVQDDLLVTGAFTWSGILVKDGPGELVLDLGHGFMNGTDQQLVLLDGTVSLAGGTLVLANLRFGDLGTLVNTEVLGIDLSGRYGWVATPILPVPEPNSIIVLLSAGMFFLRRRRSAGVRQGIPR